MLSRTGARISTYPSSIDMQRVSPTTSLKGQDRIALKAYDYISDLLQKCKKERRKRKIRIKKMQKR